MPPAAIIGAGAALGGLAGAFGDSSTSTQTSSKKLIPASELEKFSGSLSQQQLQSLQSLIGAGPGQADVSAGLEAQKGLAAMLQGYVDSGGLPTTQDLSQARVFAADLYAPQAFALQNAFQQQQQQANQLAVQLGRSVDDPILRAKLAQQQIQQLGALEAEKTAYSSQFALAQPDRRLGYASARADILQGLGQQALQNRATLFGLGQQALEGERAFRLNAADITTTGTQSSGGGFGGFLKGAIGGVGAGLGAAGALKGMSLVDAQMAVLKKTPSNPFAGMFVGPTQPPTQQMNLAWGQRPQYPYLGAPYFPQFAYGVGTGSFTNYSGKGYGPLAP